MFAVANRGGWWHSLHGTLHSGTDCSCQDCNQLCQKVRGTTLPFTSYTFQIVKSYIGFKVIWQDCFLPYVWPLHSTREHWSFQKWLSAVMTQITIIKITTIQRHLHQYTAMSECQRALNGSLITLITDTSTNSGRVLLHISSPAAYNEVANSITKHAKMPMQ